MFSVTLTLKKLTYNFFKNKSSIFFGMSFIMVGCLSAYFISNVYIKWINTPIIISLNSELSQSKDFPFPAITICNMNQARKSFVENIKKDTLENSVLSSLCYHKKMNASTSGHIYGKWSFVRKFIVNVSLNLIPFTFILISTKSKQYTF